MNTLIRNGRIFDPASGVDRVADLALAAGRIVHIGPIPDGFSADAEYDAQGCWILPGLVDLCARLGEPGGEHAGLLESEIMAAVAGGVTSLVCPPDTDPVLDEPSIVEMLRMRAERLHQSRVFPQGALTRSLQGETLAELVQLTDAGCVGFGQAEQPIRNTQVLLRAMQYASTFGYTLFLRPLEPWLSGGVAASGARALGMGLAGIPTQAETIALQRYFALQATVPELHVHVSRLSSAAGVQLVRQAKADGMNVSADVSVHSLLLTDQALEGFNASTRLTPPLRQEVDRSGLWQAVLDGTIDAIVSDHTPVTRDAKDLPFALAQPGASALELLLPMALSVAKDAQQRVRVLQALTSGPAGVLGPALGSFASSCGQLVEGGVADLCIFDPTAKWTLNAASFQSQGRHSPFMGWELTGRVRRTFVGGLAYGEFGSTG